MSLARRLDDIEYQLADLKRRQSNFARPGVVKSVNKDGSVVADVGFTTHDVPVYSHNGAGKSWTPMKAGQQIVLICPDGDLSNAFAIPGGYHDKNPAPSDNLGEDILAQRNASRFRTTDAAAFLERGGSSVKAEDGVVTIKAAKIVLDGTIYLGGADAGNPVAMLGTLDTAGNADVSNLSTVAFTK